LKVEAIEPAVKGWFLRAKWTSWRAGNPHLLLLLCRPRYALAVAWKMDGEDRDGTVGSAKDRQPALNVTEATNQERSLSAAEVKVILDRFHVERQAARKGPAKQRDKHD
jgi:hypothetical protein